MSTVRFTRHRLRPNDNSRRWILCVFLSIALSAICAIPSYAQVDAGSLQGQVSDSSGAVVPEARVTLLNENTGTEQQIATDQKGLYTFSPLRIGLYTLTVIKEGFASSKREHIQVNIQQQLSIPVELAAASVTSSVEVSTGAPILQTSSGSVGQVVDAKQINDLPINGRNYFFLAQLAPGVTFAQRDTRGQNNNGRFAANGLRATQNNYLLDGIDNNTSILSNQNGKDYVIQTPVDALSQFKVQTNNYTAEFGRAAGAVLNATVKSGTNQLHGDAWEFIRNEQLDANDYFLNKAGLRRPKYRRNQFGFTLGGPVAIPKLYDGRDKTFFFVDYEGLRQVQGNTLTGTVPTVAERSSGFTNFGDLTTQQSGTRTDAAGRSFPLGTIYDPATTRAFNNTFIRDPFPGNVIPVSRIDPNAVALLNLLPAPTSSALTSNYVAAPIFRDENNSFDVRIDQTFNASNYIFVRYSYNNHHQIHPGIFTQYQDGYADGGNSSGQSNFDDRAQNIALGYTHTFTPRLINDLRLGVNREHVLFLQPNGDVLGIPQKFGIQGIPQVPTNGGLPTFNVGFLSAFGSSGFLPSNKFGTTPQVNDDLTWVRGAHSLKFGYEQQRIIAPYLQPPASRGSFGFNGSYASVYGQTDSSTGVAQMLLLPTTTSNIAGANSVSISNFAQHDLIRNYAAGYVQDDWRASNSLTINIGLRYDFYDFMHDRRGLLANFVPAPGRVGGEYLVTPQVAAILPGNFVSALNAEGVTVRTVNGALANAQHLNFAPRFGFAQQLGTKFVVRGGYGLFYGGIENIGGSPLITGNFPVEFTIARSAPDARTPLAVDNSIGLLSSTFANLSLNPASANPTGIGLIGFQRDQKTPYAQSFNLTAQFQVTETMALSAGYVGSVSRHILAVLAPNAVGTLLPAGTTTTPYVPYKATSLGGGSLTLNNADSSFNSLQFNLEKRTSKGLSFLTNFAWQKAMTNSRDPLESTLGGYRAPFVPGAGIAIDWQRADFDVKRVFHASTSYELPYGKGRRFGGDAHGIRQIVLGGWVTNAIATVQDGQPFTVTCGLTTGQGTGCNAILKRGVNPYANGSVTHFLDINAFSNPAAVAVVGQTDLAPLGSRGSQVSGPAFHRLDFSLFKRFNFSQRIYAELRAEVFNITNTPNFANPSNLSTTTASNFAQITSTRDSPNDPREMQLALKMYW